MSLPKRTSSPGRVTLVALACVPSIDCLLNQLNNAFQINFGPLSMLQVLRGYMLAVLAAVSLWSVLQEWSRIRRVPLPAVLGLLLLFVAITKEAILTGGVSMPSIGAYGQMAYWILFWITISILCRTSQDAEIILWGLGVGATLTAVSVIAGLAFGGLNYYEDDAVRSSSGWFDTSKYITGVLVCGGVTLLYLGRSRRSWLLPSLAGLCFVACIVTYARAGAVALAAVLVWLPLWSALFGRAQARQWLHRFFVLLVLAAVLVPAFVKVDTLFARWSDLEDSDKAGSGRATFWKVAWDGYVDATPVQQCIGYGYSAMSDMLFLNYGADIKHTHNDMLDMLLVDGAVGAAWLSFLIATLAWRVLKTSLFSVEGGAGAAILLAYLVHGQFTGQLWSTDAMTYYTLALSCLSVLATSHSTSLQKQQISDRGDYLSGSLVSA